MIEEPPLLRIKRPGRRPSAAQIEAFRGALTGHVCDAQNGAGTLLGLSPLPGVPQVLVGPAMTVDAGPADVLATLAGVHQLQPGDVLVVATGGHLGCAALGDMVSGMAANGGCAGIVTDGPTRDLEGIQEVGLPVYCRGLNPNSPFGSGPGSVGYPVQIGGQTVATGDIIVGDSGGVVVVPFDQIDAVIEGLNRVRSLEAGLEAEVKAGLARPPVIDELIAAGKVRFED